MPLILGPDSPAIHEIRRIRGLGGLERVTVLVAWARITGVGLFLDAMGADIAKVRIVVGMAGAGTSAEALSYLRAHCRELHLFHKHHRQTFHPKVYCFDSPGEPPATTRLIVGSSNLTGGGLFSNYEANLVSTLEPAGSDPDRETWQSVMSAFDKVTTSLYSERIQDDARIQMLLDDGYLSTEARLRRRHIQEEAAAANGVARRGRREVPPPPLPPIRLPAAPFAFRGTPDRRLPPAPHRRPPPAPPLLPPPLEGGVIVPGPPVAPLPVPFVADGQFFVRTLTPNDVAKIRNGRAGGLEPDLGVATRDILPEFWGWPNRFIPVQRRLVRPEWTARARVFSSREPQGINMSLVQWLRAARPPVPPNINGHLAEHRLRIGPRPDFIDVIPPGFDINSLIVFERMPENEAYDFRIRILLPNEPRYAYYSPYLITHRAGHRFGYGP